MDSAASGKLPTVSKIQPAEYPERAERLVLNYPEYILTTVNQENERPCVFFPNSLQSNRTFWSARAIPAATVSHRECLIEDLCILSQFSRPSSHGKDMSAVSDHSSSPSTNSHDSPVCAAISLPFNSADPVIGQVTLSGKFKCLQDGCHDDESLTFNRLADFKRHYDNAHLGASIEYFCPQDGCPRSRNPGGGKCKGRSFKGRKDKMNEHLKTAHQKEKRKRKKYENSDDKEKNSSFQERSPSKKVKSRRQVIDAQVS